MPSTLTTLRLAVSKPSPRLSRRWLHFHLSAPRPCQGLRAELGSRSSDPRTATVMTGCTAKLRSVPISNMCLAAASARACSSHPLDAASVARRRSRAWHREGSVQPGRTCAHPSRPTLRGRANPHKRRFSEPRCGLLRLSRRRRASLSASFRACVGPLTSIQIEAGHLN